MTLLEDLESLDLSAVVDARGRISGAISSPELTSILEGGAAQTALGGLGESLAQIQGFESPEALLRPLVDAAGGLTGSFSLESLPLGEYAGAVREGAETLARLFGDVDDEPLVARLLGMTLGRLEESAGGISDGALRVAGSELVRFRGLVETVEQGIPTDPADFADLALGVLLPFPATTVKRVRAGLDGVTGGLDAVRIPLERTSGLVAAFDAITAASVALDARALERALRDLERVRAATVTSLRGELLRVSTLIDRLPVDEALGAFAEVSGVFHGAEESVLEFLERWRGELVEARVLVESADVAALLAVVPEFLDRLEEGARLFVGAEIDRQVEKLTEWVRSLLAELPLRDLRQQLTDFIHEAAQAVERADLGAPARTAREAISSVTGALAAPDLGGAVREQLEKAQEAIGGVLDDIGGALDDIGAAVDAVAGEAQGILERVADALEAFRAAIDQVTAAVEGAGLEEAGQEVVARIVELREAAEELLTAAPLPEPMRPLVEQLVDVLEGLDIEGSVRRPINSAAEALQVPDSVGATISAGLGAAQDALANLIPAELIESIRKEVDEALETLRSFDPASLLGDVTRLVDEAADAVASLDPRPLVEELAEPFDALLGLVDAAHPRRLLAPAIQGYASLLGSIAPPAPTAALQQAAGAMNTAGEAVGRALVEPVRRAAPEGTTVADHPQAEPPLEPPPGQRARPGDAVRLFGFLPQKLREALASLGAGPAGEVLAAIDGLCGGLARDLRELDAALWALDAQLQHDLDALLAPVADAQLRAQLSIQASFSATGPGKGAGVDVKASIALVAVAGPPSIRGELDGVNAQTRARARARAEAASAAPALVRIADGLERCSLARVTGDLDAFLAALDPEPIAAELDALIDAALAKTPQLEAAVTGELRRLGERFEGLVRELNPAAQAQRYLAVLGVLREELDLLDPARLADELGEVHAAARAAIAEFDPRLIAAELGEAIEAAAGALRALDPAALLGDLSLFDDLRERIDAVDPAAKLEGIGESLHEVGERLGALNPSELLAAVNGLGPRLADVVGEIAEAIRRELVALIESIKFARASASVSASAEVTT